MKFSKSLSRKSASVTPRAFMSVLLAATVLSTQAQVLPPGQDGSEGYRPGEVLIQFKHEVTDAHLAELFQKGGLRWLKQIQTKAMKARGELGITLTETPLPVA